METDLAGMREMAEELGEKMSPAPRSGLGAGLLEGGGLHGRGDDAQARLQQDVALHARLRPLAHADARAGAVRDGHPGPGGRRRPEGPESLPTLVYLNDKHGGLSYETSVRAPSSSILGMWDMGALRLLIRLVNLYILRAVLLRRYDHTTSTPSSESIPFSSVWKRSPLFLVSGTHPHVILPP
jgi:hypothetical protein